MKRLLFDGGSIAAVMSPLLLAAFFLTQDGQSIDAATVIVETSDLRPAIAAVSDAADEARLNGETQPLLTAIEDLYERRDDAAEGVKLVLPEGASEPLLTALDDALDGFTSSQAALASGPGDGSPAALAETRARDALDEILTTLSLEARDSVASGQSSGRRSLVLIVLGVATTSAALLLWRWRAISAQRRSERAGLTIRQMASQSDRADRRIRQLSNTDPLTGLPSRGRFLRELDRAIIDAKQQERSVAVLMADINRFKLINDAQGHASGDRLLIAVGKRLQQELGHPHLVARFGGDEFLVLVSGLPKGNAAAGYGAAGAAGKVVEALRAPFMHDEQELPLSASIGMSTFPGRVRNGAELIRQASAALYRAKERGSNAIHFYDPREENRAEGRLELEAELRRAIERDEFELYYQPQVDMQSREIRAVEALLRWKHPHRGLVLPSEFVPLLEEMGEIVPVGRWAMARACADAQSWVDEGLPAVRVAINLSVHEFLDPQLIGVLERTIQETGIDPARLEFEITETVAMTNVEPAIRILSELHGLGVRTALDDFGSGYSSLGRLNEFPVHTLKIDRSFIASLGGSDSDQALVKGVIALGHAMELHIVAEGIENDLQAHVLKALGTDLGQGFAYSEAVDEPAMRKLLAEGIDLPQLSEAAG